MIDDSDIIGLQVLAIHGLQEEKNQLVERIDHLEAQIKLLENRSKEQTQMRIEFLMELVYQRAQELSTQGKCITEMADEELARIFKPQKNLSSYIMYDNFVDHHFQRSIIGSSIAVKSKIVSFSLNTIR